MIKGTPYFEFKKKPPPSRWNWVKNRPRENYVFKSTFSICLPCSLFSWIHLHSIFFEFRFIFALVFNNWWYIFMTFLAWVTWALLETNMKNTNSESSVMRNRNFLNLLTGFKLGPNSLVQSYSFSRLSPVIRCNLIHIYLCKFISFSYSTILVLRVAILFPKPV